MDVATAVLSRISRQNRERLRTDATTFFKLGHNKKTAHLIMSNLPSFSPRMHSPLCRPFGVILAGLLIATWGCSSNSHLAEVTARNTSNIQRLSNFYQAFQSNRFGQGPKDETELKNYIQTQPTETFHLMGIDPENRDSIWISERDHKPFKVRYNVSSPFGALAAVVFEQEGVGGIRQVGLNNSKVEEADDAHYKELWEGRGLPKPAPIGAPPPAAANK
jgi:hypothetical protein